MGQHRHQRVAAPHGHQGRQAFQAHVLDALAALGAGMALGHQGGLGRVQRRQRHAGPARCRMVGMHQQFVGLEEQRSLR